MSFFIDWVKMCRSSDGNAAIRICINCRNRTPCIIGLSTRIRDRCFRPAEESHLCIVTAGICCAEIADFYSGGRLAPICRELYSSGIGYREGPGIAVILVVEHHISIFFVTRIKMYHAGFRDVDMVKIVG